jgi:hypothetical protein
MSDLVRMMRLAAWLAALGAAAGRARTEAKVET